MEQFSDHATSEKSKTKITNFEKLNRLGNKRRSKSTMRLAQETQESQDSIDYGIDVSPKNCAIDKMPINNIEKHGLISKISNFTNALQPKTLNRKTYIFITYIIDLHIRSRTI